MIPTVFCHLVDGQCVDNDHLETDVKNLLGRSRTNRSERQIDLRAWRTRLVIPERDECRHSYRFPVVHQIAKQAY